MTELDEGSSAPMRCMGDSSAAGPVCHPLADIGAWRRALFFAGFGDLPFAAPEPEMEASREAAMRAARSERRGRWLALLLAGMAAGWVSAGARFAKREKPAWSIAHGLAETASAWAEAGAPWAEGDRLRKVARQAAKTAAARRRKERAKDSVGGAAAQAADRSGALGRAAESEPMSEPARGAATMGRDAPKPRGPRRI
jgi:hypothetical protein